MDNNNFNFTTIWQQQNIVQPNKDELLNKLKLFKKNNLHKLIVTNILLIATSGFIIFIWLHYQPQYLSSKIGIILIILAMAIYLFVSNKQFSIFTRSDDTQTNNDYLKSLIALKTKQKHIQTIILGIYFIMLSSGICLYMYEYTLKMTVFGAICAYGITLTWLCFNWFYIRPKTIKKQQSKLDELISTFKTVNKQLNEE